MRIPSVVDAFASARKKHLEVGYKAIGEGIKWEGLCDFPQFRVYLEGLYKRLSYLKEVGFDDTDENKSREHRIRYKELRSQVDDIFSRIERKAQLMDPTTPLGMYFKNLRELEEKERAT